MQFGVFEIINFLFLKNIKKTFLCGLVVRVSGYRSGGPGSITGVIRFSEK
jgi:hypothetical protein